MSKGYTVQKVGDELANAVKIREALAEHDDPQLILDMIEGSTELHEAICVLDEENARDEALVAGIKAHVETMEGRAARLERGIEARRNIILMAMDRAGIPSIKYPLATITARATPPGVDVADESLIPARFWKPSDPKLDKKALNEAVKAGEDIPGARKTNGGISLQIRRN